MLSAISVIEDNVHTFDVHTSAEQIRGDENTCLEFFEFFVTCQAKRRQETLALHWMSFDEFHSPFFLSHAAMNFHGGKVLFGEDFA